MNAYEQSQSFAEINNISLHYSLEGDEKKPLLALINMASHNLTCWEVVLNGLLEHFRVLRFDIRGTGRSGWGADTDFTFSQYADDLAGLMDALSLPPAFVLGVAYGARTAARFALQHPEKLTVWHYLMYHLRHPWNKPVRENWAPRQGQCWRKQENPLSSCRNIGGSMRIVTLPLRHILPTRVRLTCLKNSGA